MERRSCDAAPFSTSGLDGRRDSERLQDHGAPAVLPLRTRSGSIQ
jgi:hypothetical protein